MAVLAPHFLRSILTCHENLQQQIPYPFFDPACVHYEDLLLLAVQGASPEEAIETFGLSAYELRKSAAAFARCGAAGRSVVSCPGSSMPTQTFRWRIFIG